MNSPCSRCGKVVYPLEKVTLAGKTWHKTCTTCAECLVRLNTADALADRGEIYCKTHVPKFKASAVMDKQTQHSLTQKAPALTHKCNFTRRETEDGKFYSAAQHHYDVKQAKLKAARKSVGANAPASDEGLSTGKVAGAAKAVGAALSDQMDGGYGCSNASAHFPEDDEGMTNGWPSAGPARNRKITPLSSSVITKSASDIALDAAADLGDDSSSSSSDDDDKDNEKAKETKFPVIEGKGEILPPVEDDDLPPFPACIPCNKCDKDIGSNENYAYSDEHVFHIDCFHCNKCSTKFDADTEFIPHISKSGKCKTYCLDCHNEKRSKKNPCCVCSKGISPTEDWAKYGDKVYHMNCFNCTTCTKVLDLNSFYDINDKFICKECRNAERPQCDSCHSALTGSYAMVGEKQYHPECIKCSTCDVPLGEKIHTHEGKLLCEEHASL